MNKSKIFFALVCIGLCAEAVAAEAVACLGKVVPGERVQSLAAVSPTGGQAIVESLFIKKGKRVKSGETVAQIQGIESARAELKGAETSLKVAEATRDIKILQQKNLIEDLNGTYSQNSKVITEKEPPRREREELEYEQERIQRRIAQSKAMLPLVEASENAAVENAKSEVLRARARLAEYTIKSPIDGEIVEVNTKTGEAVGSDGICEIADTDSMYVEAEVYVSDISKIKVGYSVEISSDAIKGKKFGGKVSSISGYVKGNKIFSSDPSDYANTRVVMVKIKIDSPEIFRNLIGTQVNVRILFQK